MASDAYYGLNEVQERWFIHLERIGMTEWPPKLLEHLSEVGWGCGEDLMAKVAIWIRDQHD
jgi:hypothetical protein